MTDHHDRAARIARLRAAVGNLDDGHRIADPESPGAAMAQALVPLLSDIARTLSQEGRMPPALAWNFLTASMGTALGAFVSCCQSDASLPRHAQLFTDPESTIETVAAMFGDSVRVNILSGFAQRNVQAADDGMPTPATAAADRADAAPADSAPPVTDSAGNPVDLATLRPAGRG